jgi:hypothetical protein
MMKNGVFFTVLMLLAVSSFAQDIQNRYLFLEGSASRPEHVDFFRRSFSMEADGCGYIITSTVGEALHTLRFRVASNTVYDPDYDMDIEQNTITMSLHRNADNAQLVTFDFNFATVEETYPFIRTLFLNSVTPIPIPYLTEENLIMAQGTHWDKWVYLRASFDYPITFYLLQPTGLKGGIGLYSPNEDRVSPIDHKIMAMPGATLGVEVQFLNFLSFELDFLLNMGDTRNNYFINMAAGGELKFPVKFRNLMLVPYGAFFYNLNVSTTVFNAFPPYAAGGGIQVCARAGKKGILFIDVQYTFAFSEAIMRNPYLDFPEDERIFPEPPEIYYKRSQLGIGIGYKFGLIDRPKKTATFTY